MRERLALERDSEHKTSTWILTINKPNCRFFDIEYIKMEASDMGSVCYQWLLTLS